MKRIKLIGATICFALSYVIAVQAADFTSLIGVSYVIDAGFYQAYWGFPPAAET
jgi:hypothetical protein